jgi:aspartate 1-decarboxylase
MQRIFLNSKIHRATVTEKDLNYIGSISIDQDIINAAGMLPDEQVEIYNITNGERFTTYIIQAPAGSGTIGLNGAAAHKVSLGDKVIIVTYTQLTEKEIQFHSPRILVVESCDNLKFYIKEG